jgi:hypothetical protein
LVCFPALDFGVWQSYNEKVFKNGGCFMNKWSKLICLPLSLIFLCSCGPNNPAVKPSATATKTQQGTTGSGASYGDGYNFNYLCGVDQFGRAFLPSMGQKEDKEVGIFYFLWLGMENTMRGIYDNTKLLAENPDALWDKAGSEISPTNQFHYWGEPMFGYYKSTDEFVLRRHIEMLTMAGVDFMVFDATNANTYDTVWKTLLPLLDEYQQQGWDVPKIAFWTNSYSTLIITRLYENLYSKNYYPNLWYKPDGEHPMIIGYDNTQDDKAEAATRSRCLRKYKTFLIFAPRSGRTQPIKKTGFLGWNGLSLNRFITG